MSFADPQSINPDSTASVNLNRISTEGRKSIYSNPEGTLILTLSHQPTKDRIRTMARIDMKAIVADPITAVNDEETLSLHIVLDRPNFGFEQGDVTAFVSGFTTWLTESSLAATVKLFGGQT